MGDGDMIEKPNLDQFEPSLPRPEQPIATQALQHLEPTRPLVPSTVEARSLLAPKSVFAQIIETQVLPPERFKEEQKGQILDFKQIGDKLAVLEKVKDYYEAVLYDGHGNTTRVLLDPTNKDIAAKTTRNFLTIRATPSEYSEDTSKLLKKLGYSDKVVTRLKKEWLSKASQAYDGDRKGDVSINSVENGAQIILNAGDWKLNTRQTSSGKEYFVFTVDDTHIFIDPDSPRSKQTIAEQNYQATNNPATKLPGGLRFDQQSTIVVITDENGKQIASYSGTEAHTDPTNPGNLYFINTGQIYKLDITGVKNRTTIPLLETQIKVEDPQEIQFDPNGNFLIIRSGSNKLSIVEKETGDIVKDFNGVKGPILVNDQGDILYVDPQGKLREIQTNFQAIPAGGSEAAQKKRDEELRQMQERFANLELKKVERSRTGQISEDTVANTLRENLSRQVSEQISTATNPEAIEDVLDRLQALKGDPANQAYTEVIDEFVNQAREKLSGIRTAEFSDQLTAFQQALDEVKSVGDTIGLDEQFGKLLELRQKIDVTNPQQRREIEQRMRALQTKKDTLNNQYQGELIEAVNQTLPQIEQLVKETGSPQELAFFGSSSQAQQFEMMLANVKDPQVRKELRDRYNGVRTEQRAKLEESSKQLAEQDRQRWAQVVEEAREDLSALQEQIAQLSDAKEIDRFGRHPLVTAWRSKLFALPPELREIEEKRLEIILGARQKDMEHRKELGAVGETGELRFGQATFPIYKEPPRLWQPKFVPIKGGLTEWADLVFEDLQGRIWRPGEEGEKTVVVADLNDERTKMMVERYRREADEYFKGIKRRVPEFDEHWRITGFHMEKLEEVAEALKLQLQNHRGITILQGEAGTGKNVLVDILGNLSNREVISIACNENSAKEDLTYEFYFDPGKGTYKLPSRMVEGLQTPGAIILFDEINALKPGIAKMLNSLFDYRRRIYLAEGGKDREIIADPTVLFIGTMNPQNYAGVNRLSPEVKSRSRVIDIEYPPFEERRGGRTHYRSDEAEMLAAYMDDLSALRQNELRQVWDYAINRDQSSGGDMIVQGNPQIETDVRRIYDVVRVANRLREMYSAYQTGDSNEPMDFPTSLREVTDIVMEMNHRQGVKPMIKRVIVPKIDDRRQKRLVEQTIDAVLPD